MTPRARAVAFIGGFAAIVLACSKWVSESEPLGDFVGPSFISIQVQSKVGTMGPQTPVAVWALMPKATASSAVTFSTNYKGATFATTGAATDVVRAIAAADTSKVIASTLLIVGDTLKTATITDTQYVLVRATVGASSGSPGYTDTTTIKFVPSPPAIVLSPDSTSFLLVDSIPGPQSVAIVDGGVAALTGLAVGPIVFDRQPGNWLSASLSAGSTAPATMTLTIAKGTDSTLAAGTYVATVPVSSTARGVTGNRVVRVTLVVKKTSP
jgi:hypothetical protein